MTQTPAPQSAPAEAPLQYGPGQPLPWEPVLMAAVGRKDGHLLPDYLVRGGYKALETCTSMTPDEVIKVVTEIGRAHV